MTIMRKLFGTALLAGMLFTGSPAFSAPQVSLGIRVGPPPRPRYVRVRPIAPGPDYYWVDGYWYPVGRHYRWHSGYWTRPPYSGAVWVGPRYESGEFYGGYWNGDRGEFRHDHRWDRDRDRDRDRWRDHDRDHDHDHR
ncbi:MAG: YXWGXW repeat-containing protein [Acidobacteriota bacterium]|nr:YXWGXW repeat-containing protein [Acidobacteriota bacterium]